ncbi:heterokaryon incompatibility protein-domain-containing protein [Phaeosphaeriaceae sp. PMI808]|nr:heterokaryon incompatibility protein-domain-containing protein [Phaeosphaeriaceae sp. PMI808]
MTSETEGVVENVQEANPILCHVCSSIDFKSLTTSSLKIYALGTLQEVASRTSCPACKLFIEGVELAWTVSATWIKSQERPIRCWIRNIFWAQHCSNEKSNLMPRMKNTFHYRTLLGTDWVPGHREKSYGEHLVRYTVTAIDVFNERHGYEFLTPTNNNLEQLFERRQIRDQVDIDLLRAWLMECRNHHFHSSCHPKLDLRRLRNAQFRVIDVVESRLIEGLSSCRYVALSYVWGTWAARHRISRLRVSTDGMLSLDELPLTIKDAIHLTNLLGERYLWVDQICIDQENEMDKAGLIRHMGTIYESACFTIVAAAGGDANHGLPGLYPQSRRSDTIVAISKDSATIYLALSRPSLHSVVGKSHWNTRAWTWQEHVLSLNCLFFTGDEVFYSCPDNLSVAPAKGGVDFTGFDDARFSNWREAYYLETRGLRTTYQSQIEWDNGWDRIADPLIGRLLDTKLINHWGDLALLEKGFGRKDDRFFQLAKRSPKNEDLPFLQYAEFVTEYSQRRLTNSEDILNAFAGVLVKVSDHQEINTTLEHGLPMKYLQIALLWSSTDPTRFSRRKSKTFDEFQFPSWSWIGWEGPVAYYPVAKANPDWLGGTGDYSAKRFNPPWDARPKIGVFNVDGFSSFEVTKEKAIVGNIANTNPTSSLPQAALRSNVLVLWTACRPIGNGTDKVSEIIANQTVSFGGSIHIDSTAAAHSGNSLDLPWISPGYWELVIIAYGTSHKRFRMDEDEDEEWIALLVWTHGIWSERFGIARFPRERWEAGQEGLTQRWVCLR